MKERENVLRYQVTLIHYEQVDAANEERHLVAYGIVAGPDDLNADTGKKIDLKDLEYTAHYFLSHYDEIETPEGCAVVESYIVPVDGAEIAGVPVYKGSWVMAFEITDSKLWRQIESDELESFEIMLPISDFKQTPEMINRGDIQELTGRRDTHGLINIYLKGNQTLASKASEAIIEVGEPAAEELRLLLSDRSLDSFKRTGIAQLLAAICGSRSTAALVSVLLNRSDEVMVRDFIPAILGDLQDENAIAPLVEVILDEDDAEMLRVFAGAALERIVPWERIDPNVREVITEIGPTEFKALTPAVSREAVQKMLEEGSYSYPLYALLLYTEMDKPFARFVSSNGRWLHELSGDGCLIIAIENPKRWGKAWQNYWREKLGSDFDLKMMKFLELTPVDRDIAFGVAENLGVDKNLLPCIVFVDPDSIHEVLIIPVMAEEAEYGAFFMDLFTAATRASHARQGQKIRDLKKAWLKYWLKWSANQKAKLLEGKMRTWGSILAEFEELKTIFNILLPFVPFFVALLPMTK